LDPLFSLDIGDRKRKLTVKSATWSYIDCCCDACPTRQRPPTLTLSGTDLVDEDGLPKLFNKTDDFLRVSGLIEDLRNLPLF